MVELSHRVSLRAKFTLQTPSFLFFNSSTSITRATVFYSLHRVKYPTIKRWGYAVQTVVYISLLGGYLYLMTACDSDNGVLKCHGLIYNYTPRTQNTFTPTGKSLGGVGTVVPTTNLNAHFLPNAGYAPGRVLPILSGPIVRCIIRRTLSPRRISSTVVIASPNGPRLLGCFRPSHSLRGLLHRHNGGTCTSTITRTNNVPISFHCRCRPGNLNRTVHSTTSTITKRGFLILLNSCIMPGHSVYSGVLTISGRRNNTSIVTITTYSPRRIDHCNIVTNRHINSLRNTRSITSTRPNTI